MPLDQLDRRLRRIEAGRREDAPTRIAADYPISDTEADAALFNWRVRVAKGEASVRNGVLWLVSPELTAEEWARRHVTAY